MVDPSVAFLIRRAKRSILQRNFQWPRVNEFYTYSKKKWPWFEYGWPWLTFLSFICFHLQVWFLGLISSLAPVWTVWSSFDKWWLCNMLRSYRWWLSVTHSRWPAGSLLVDLTWPDPIYPKCMESSSLFKTNIELVLGTPITATAH